MNFLSAARRPMLCFLALLVIAGCSGIEPLELTNTREEGPERGLFSGSDGEFVIHRGEGETVTGNEDESTADEVIKE